MSSKKRLSRKKRQNTKNKLNANRQFKDKLFKFIFGNPEHKDWTLALYNAVNGSSYTDPEEIKITTLKDVIYVSMRNDVSFLIANTMNFYEMQSTYNPNMPMRCFIYAARVYAAYAESDTNDINLFSLRRQKFPVPRLVCFYNGQTDTEDIQMQYLKDAFLEDIEADICLKVKMININYGRNAKLLKACLPLRDYSLFVHDEREILARNEDMDMGIVVSLAIDRLPEDSVIKPFLLEHKAEVIGMCTAEYKKSKFLAKFKKEYLMEGREQGREEGEDKLSLLLQKLIAQGKSEDAQRALVDKEHRKYLYKEYGLNDLNAA